MSQACRGPIRAVVGDAFSEEMIDDMVARLAARARRLGLSDPDLSTQDALRKASQELSADDLRDSLIQKRMETFAALARSKRAARFASSANGDLGKVLEEFNVGSSRLKAQTQNSVDARGRGLGDLLRGDIVRGLYRIEGAMARLNNWLGNADQDFEADVARELGRLNGGKGEPSADSGATKVAHVLKDTQDKAVKMMNDAGAWIANMPGYVTRQNHDAIRVSGGFFKGAKLTSETTGAAVKAWADKIQPLLDERTFARTDEIVLAKFERAKSDQAKVRVKMEERLAAREAKINTTKGKPLERLMGEIDTLKSSLADHGDYRNALADMNVAHERELIGPARSDFLRQVWNDIVLGKSADDASDLSDLTGFTPPAGTAKSVSRQRVLHFKSPDDWLAYHREYGSGSFLETYLLGIERSAKAVALMDAWGPNPRAAFDAERVRLTERAEASGDIKAARAIKDDGRVREFDVLMGMTDGPRGGNEARAATIGKLIRMQQSMAKLGGMTLTSISDIGSAATQLNRAGVPLFDAYSEVLAGITRMQPADARQAGELVGVTMRAIAGDIAGNFATGDTVVGKMSKYQNAFYKINLFEMWQTGARRGVSTGLARMLGGLIDTAHEGLTMGVRQGLERYGIDKGLWDLVRRHGGKLDPQSQSNFLTPDAAAKITGDEAVAWMAPPKMMDVAKVRETRSNLKGTLGLLGYDDVWGDEWPTWTKLPAGHKSPLEKAGMTKGLWDRARTAGDLDGVQDRTIAKEAGIDDIWTDSQKQNAQVEAQIRMQAWFSGIVDDAMTEPRAAEKAVLTWGTRDGTALGVAIRLATQFKSFPYTMITRNILPTMHETAASLAAIRNGDAGIEALGRPAMMIANTLVGLTVLGYLGNAAKDIVAGKEPRPIFDEENGGLKGETFMRSFLTGGAAGFYGDILFASGRKRQGIISAVAGPAVGTVEEFLSMFADLRDGDDNGDVGPDALRFGLAQTPFLNLFYTRAALNYGLLYSMQEAASPGYLARMERRMQEKEGRGFYLEPPQLDESRASE